MNKVLGYRKMLNKTQREIAELIGVSEQTFRNKEKGKVSFKKEEMVKFKNFLEESGLHDVTIEKIFFE
ncbi:helix-turn-helix transcriptional regulator [Staphylococcus chromogenes]|uniref:helix-turn-helix transcriptional regulator n=1 Tax=Staphylococcus chromogenes TaxID=46126 RepID=UPI000D0362A4|nr:helix-turn-helix domain-containing protein [Staphylococcus chromogenes]